MIKINELFSKFHSEANHLKIKTLAKNSVIQGR